MNTLWMLNNPYQALSHILFQAHLNLKTKIEKTSAEMRQENVKYLFVRTIHSYQTIVDTYDYTFSRLAFHNNKYQPIEFIHKRALELSLKLLTNLN
jgi:hypothetical protein